MDALEGSYNAYLETLEEEIDFDTYFTYNIYHTPFAGMAFQAHRTLCNITRPRKKAEIREDFEKKVYPGLKYSRQLGSTYGSSNFVGICSLFDSDIPMNAGDRIGCYAYGSGAIGEYYSITVSPEGRETVKQMDIQGQFSKRRRVSVSEYETIEKEREKYIENPDFSPNFDIVDGWYEDHYQGKGLLVLKKVDNFYRTYELS